MKKIILTIALIMSLFLFNCYSGDLGSDFSNPLAADDSTTVATTQTTDPATTTATTTATTEVAKTETTTVAKVETKDASGSTAVTTTNSNTAETTNDTTVANNTTGTTTTDNATVANNNNNGTTATTTTDTVANNTTVANNGTTTTTTTEPVVTPQDQVKDVVDNNTKFDYSTIKSVNFSLTFKDENSNPISQAVVTLKDQQNVEITKSITDDNGKAEFTASIDRVNTTITVNVDKAGYNEKTFTVDNVIDMETVNREVFVEKVAVNEPVKVLDSDNDGVPDANDEFPFDAKYVSSAKASYTMTFEDLYPSKGDADFNDIVVRLSIEERINADNKVASIILQTKVLASGAGYKNRFGIYINGQKYILIENAKTDLQNVYNTKSTDKYVSAPIREKVIDFPVPVDRSVLGSMPYDPFVNPNQVVSREIHLPFVNTAYTGVVLDVDKFPWAMLVPDKWAWPLEGKKISQAYPAFDAWYKSGGTVNLDWYEHPNFLYTYNKATE